MIAAAKGLCYTVNVVSIAFFDWGWRVICLRHARRAAYLIALLSITLLPNLVVDAQAPDYAEVGSWVLPWGCGEAYRVSWEPEGHWAYGKARGVAYDFALPEGTPLYAPLDGVARFRQDTRSLETNLGHYIDILSPSGDWLLRLAHLRDPQQGERTVDQGELIGFSGRSGVTADHLHLELLTWDGAAWVAPELEGFERLYGVPRSSLFEGAYILRQGCQPELLQEGAITLLPPEAVLGREALLCVPLDNIGGEVAAIEWIQLVFQSPLGEQATVDFQGHWRVPAEGQLVLECPLWLDRPGDWRLLAVTCLGDQVAASWETDVSLYVDADGLAVDEVVWAATDLLMGDSLMPELLLTVGADDWAAAAIGLEGTRPDGGTWRMALQTVDESDAGALRMMPITPLVVDQVGDWRLETLALEREGRRYALALTTEAATVYGPQLVVRGVNSYRGAEQLSLFLRLTNTGTAPLEASALDVWGRVGEGELILGGRQELALLWPHAPVFVQIDVPLEGELEEWEWVEAGYWYRGDYYPLTLPQPSQVPLHAPALDVVTSREYGLRIR